MQARVAAFLVLLVLAAPNAVAQVPNLSDVCWDVVSAIEFNPDEILDDAPAVVRVLVYVILELVQGDDFYSNACNVSSTTQTCEGDGIASAQSGFINTVCAQAFGSARTVDDIYCDGTKPANNICVYNSARGGGSSYDSGGSAVPSFSTHDGSLPPECYFSRSAGEWSGCATTGAHAHWHAPVDTPHVASADAYPDEWGATPHHEYWYTWSP